MNVPSSPIVGCSAVDEHLDKPIPEILWHYTSFAGLQGILDSKKIWATEYRFLNDRQEFLHAKTLVQSLLDEEPELTDYQFPAQNTIRQAINIAFNTGNLQAERLSIMVASFSEEGDQLSQWRGYSDDSRGVSIGIDLRNLRPPSAAGTTVTFAPCIYKENDKRTLLKAILAHFQNGLQQWWNTIVEEGKSKFKNTGFSQEALEELTLKHADEQKKTIERGLAALQYDLLRTAPLLKDESFSEEKEWRLVLPWNNITLPMAHPIQLRAVRDTLIPYIAYPLNNPNQDGPIFLKDVILGAGSHPSAEIGVNLCLRKYGIPIMAKSSKVPYRPK